MRAQFRDMETGRVWEGEVVLTPAPLVASRVQVRAVLLGDGDLDAVDAAMDLGPPDVLLAWTEAVEFEEGGAVMTAIRAVLDLSEDDGRALLRRAQGFTA